MPRLIETVVLFLSCVGCLTGCMTEEQRVARIRDHSLGQRRIFDIEAISRTGYSPDAHQVLVESLHDEDPVIRCYAAEALSVCISSDEKENHEAIQSLVRLLDDRSLGKYCAYHDGIFWEGRTPSVRVMALLTLVRLTNQDHGFEKITWENALANRYAPAEPPKKRQRKTTSGTVKQ